MLLHRNKTRHTRQRGIRRWQPISSGSGGRSFPFPTSRASSISRARSPKRGVELLSTGGTAAALSGAGLAVVDVAQITGFPEMMDGRLKTLHPRVHGGLLAIRSEPAHQAAMIANDIAPIDLLVVNLYPFEATLRGSASFEDRIENIDIGGPAMIRAAAKNHDDVVVIVDVDDYPALIEELRLQRRGDQPRLPPPDGAEGLRPDRGLRRRDLQLACARGSRNRAEVARLRRRPASKLRRASLRREPASARGALPDRRDPRRRRDRAPGPGQGAVLQQHQRHRCGLRARGRIRSRRKRRGGDHQARQPMRRRGSAQRLPRPTRRRWPAIPSRPSAASSR